MSSFFSFRHAASTISASSANGTTRIFAVLLVEDAAAGGRAGDEGAAADPRARLLQDRQTKMV